MNVFISSLLIACWSPAVDNGPELVDIGPITDQIILVHLNEGHVVHHGLGQKRSDEKVIIAPLDIAAASDPSSYRITSPNDAAFHGGLTPLKVGRKSKGTDFAWFVDSWVNGAAVNNRPDHTKEHWLYLRLNAKLKSGATYTVSAPKISNGREWTFKYEATSSRSEAVHVNLLGYAPRAPAKFAYVYHWAGDQGSIDFGYLVGQRFRLVDLATGKSVFQGKVAFRKDKNNPETYVQQDTPHANFLGADVYECDFSPFVTPGKYRVAVDGVGASFPFLIDADVYRSAFTTVARGLYHNRSGIALKKPFTEFERPAPHNPKLTPGFAGRLKYTSVRMQDWGSEGGSKATIVPGYKGELDTCGWYQDAGDWDSYVTHLRVAQELLFAYQMAPENFADRDLNIPESGNGVPDILDEAAWLPRFCYRLRHELLNKKWGTGGIGLRVAGDAFGDDGEGKASYQDVGRDWYASGEDAQSTYRYAGVAAHLASALKIAGVKDPQGIDWRQEATESFAWAQKNARANEHSGDKAHKIYAAAALLQLTGDRAYEQVFREETSDLNAKSLLYGEAMYGPALYALSTVSRSPDLVDRVRDAVLNTSDEIGIRTPSKRALRWGGDFGFPMLVGQQTTPEIMAAAIGYTLTVTSDKPRAKQYLSAIYTTCDYFLGSNPLNMTWVTGLGARSPHQVFHMDAWYNGKPTVHPGIIPYGPWRKGKDQGEGPWSSDWANKTIYPAGIDNWPGAERWFENRCSPLTSEFTIHQNTAPAAAIFGFLCAPRRAH